MNSSIEVREIIRGLPAELVRYIITFTYSCQSPDLLEDIRSFYNDKKKVQVWYYHNFNVRFYMNSTEDQDWMANDIIRYFNEDQATMNGYHDHFFDLCSRFFSLDSQEKQHRFIDAILEPRVKPMRCFNVLWGILLPPERKEFIRGFVYRF
jgi:hypothetical protein